MPSLLRMPEVAADTPEATLVSWPLPENTAYSASDVIACVETAKAGVDIEAEADGVILKTLVPAGTDVKVGEPIALIGAPGESVGDIDAVLAQLLGTAPSGATAGPPGTAPTTEQAAVTDPQQAPGSVTRTAIAITAQPPAGPGRENQANGRIFSSPLARRLAHQAGLTLAEIPGTGPNQRVTRRDVEAAVAAREAAAATPALPSPAARPAEAAPQASAAQAVDQAKPVVHVPVVSTEATAEPHSRLRRTIAARLSESKQTVPHFYVRGSARVDALLDLRAQINKAAGVKVSINDLITKAAAVAHTLTPAMNVIWSPETLLSFERVDISVAIAGERGLVTPVIRDVGSLTVSAIAAIVKDYVARANDGRLRQDELTGGTLTISNLGMFGTEEFAAIINPPQSAILAVGAIRDEPLVRDGRIEAGKVMRVTLSADHRPIDGAVAAEWMRTFLALLEDPLRIMI